MTRIAPTAPLTLPYRFDTSSVWHTILKGAFGLNVVLICGLVFSVFARPWPHILGLAVIELAVFAFTRVFVRHQEGSMGTLTADAVDVEPNTVLGITLPGPRGTYTLDRFLAVRVEFRSAPITLDAATSGGPHEIVWLVGRPGTPDVAVARTDDGVGRNVGQELGALLKLPVEEVGAPIAYHL
jgi:hypothetical protein